jgi:hypothetical protein
MSVKAAISSVKKAMGWGSVVEDLERLAAIEGRLPQVDAELQAERLPLPVAEHTARVITWLQRKRAFYAAWSDGTPRDMRVHLSRMLVGLAALEPRDPAVGGVEELEAFVFGFLGPLLEQQAARVVGELALPGDGRRGRPLAERGAIVERLTQERRALVAEHRRLVEQITATTEGKVTAEHLAETQAVIVAEVRAKEQADLDAKRRLQREQWERERTGHGRPETKFARQFPDDPTR